MFQKAYPSRCHRIHVVNPWSMVETGIALFKPFIAKKLQDRVSTMFAEYLMCYNTKILKVIRYIRNRKIIKLNIFIVVNLKQNPHHSRNKRCSYFVSPLQYNSCNMKSKKVHIKI